MAAHFQLGNTPLPLPLPDKVLLTERITEIKSTMISKNRYIHTQVCVRLWSGSGPRGGGITQCHWGCSRQ